MREFVARGIVLLSLGLVVALAALFASRHNPEALAAHAPPAVPAAPAHGRGEAVFESQNCSVCHSIAGKGNPRLPLDGIGSRMNAAELRSWATGTGAAADVLPAAIAKRKQRILEIPGPDLDALITYLSTLTSPGVTTKRQ